MIFGHLAEVSGLFYDFSTMMVLVNSCVNPFIYAAKYRESVPADRAKYREFQTGVRCMLRKQVESSVQTAEMQMCAVSGQ